MPNLVNTVKLLGELGFKDFHCDNINNIDEELFKKIINIENFSKYATGAFKDQHGNVIRIYDTRYDYRPPLNFPNSGRLYPIGIRVFLRFYKYFKGNFNSMGILMLKATDMKKFFQLLYDMDMDQIKNNILGVDIDHKIEKISLCSNTYRDLIKEVMFCDYEFSCKGDNLYTIIKTISLLSDD